MLINNRCVFVPKWGFTRLTKETFVNLEKVYEEFWVFFTYVKEKKSFLLDGTFPVGTHTKISIREYFR